MTELKTAPDATRLPDVEGTVRFLSTEEGGRRSPVRPGYRPSHLVMKDCLTIGVHDYPDVEEVGPGATARVTITFVTPEQFPDTLWVGKTLTLQEGSHVVGHATITKVYNELLLGTD